MHKHLATFVEQSNFTRRIFGGKVLSVSNLTAADRAELLDELEGALSPENLCCDGELRGAPLRKKAAMLNGAKAELERLQVGGTYK